MFLRGKVANAFPFIFLNIENIFLQNFTITHSDLASSFRKQSSYNQTIGQYLIALDNF
jgi:hypothetical protein